MSHIAEGALHAYLDGALDEYPAAEAREVREHLEACAQCRTRLDAERVVRDSAAGILGHAVPQVDVPSFEELRAYVRASRGPRKAEARLYRLGWAASVVLAVGTGWMLRGGEAIPTYVEAPASVIEADVVSSEQADVVADAPTVAVGAAQASPDNQSVSAEAVYPVAPADGPSAPVPSAVAAGEPSRRVAVDGVAAPAEARSPSVEAAPSPDARLSEELAVAERRRTVPVTEPPSVAAAAPMAGVAVTPAEVRPIVAGQGASADAVALADDAAGQDREEEEVRGDQAAPRDRSDPTYVTSAIATQRAAPRAAEAASRDRSSADFPLVVPGLQSQGLSYLGEGTTRAGVVVPQLLESGDTLEVFSLPVGVDPSILPELPEGKNEIRTHFVGTGWLVLRAPLEMEDLQVLLSRLMAAH